MNNLIIIGNGFDLAHGLKTSYNHFIEHMVNKHCNDRSFYADLLQFPMHGLISSNNFMNTLKSERFLLGDNPFKSYLIKDLINDFSLKNWCDIEEKYFLLLNTDNKDIAYFQNPKLLNKDFELLKNYLEEYLIEQEKEAKAIDSYSKFFASINSPNTLLLNFNYTHTIENLYKTETSRSKIIHIHGELANPYNPIIFGYAADHDESRVLLDKNDKEYLRYIKNNNTNEQVMSTTYPNILITMTKYTYPYLDIHVDYLTN